MKISNKVQFVVDQKTPFFGIIQFSPLTSAINHYLFPRKTLQLLLIPVIFKKRKENNRLLQTFQRSNTLIEVNY